ncbi:MAG: ATP-binding cassette domain-containing protein [Terriglobales bacterium]
MLRIENLSVSVAGRQLLREVSLEVSGGAAVALVGESGSGKTTLLGACLGLLPPEMRVAGRVDWQRRNLLDCTPAEWRRLRRRELALIPQEPSAALDPRRTAAAHLRECLPGGSVPARVQQLWAQAGLADAPHDSYPHQWSGGMQQRLLIAMALARRPQMLLADEPTSALDPLHQAQLLALIAHLSRSSGFGLLWVTHDLAAAAQIAEQVVVLRAGSVVEQGTVARVFTRPQSAYTAALVRQQPGWSRT